MKAALLVLLLWTTGATARPQYPNCTIWVNTWDRRGASEEKVLYARSETKRSCRDLASLHRPIYNQRGKVSRKHVRYRFREVRWGRVNHPSLKFTR